jgi:putative MATE family efflux protein
VKPPARVATILALAGPAIAGMLLQTGVLYADRVMLGHHSGASLAAMQIAGPLEWTLVSVTSSFAVGTLALVGRAVGAGDRDAARRHATMAIAVALVLGVLVAIAAFVLVLPFLHLLFPRAGEALSVSRDYLKVALIAAPFYCIGAAGFAALSASGDTVTPLKIGVVVNVAHIAINYALIPKYGAAGAGVSTAFSYAIEAALTCIALQRRQWLSGKLLRADARELFSISAPATTERVIYHAAYMAFVWMIARLGDDAMASNQALIAIEAISFMTVEGFATACGALVAQELGAQRPEHARRVGWWSMWLAVATLSTFGVAFVLLRHRLPALVTPRLDLQIEAANALLIVAIAQPFMAAGVVLGQGVRGAGATRIALLVSLVGGFGVRLIATWIATSHGLGVTGVWIGSTCDWVTRTLLLIVIWRSAAWRSDAHTRDFQTSG